MNQDQPLPFPARAIHYCSQCGRGSSAGPCLDHGEQQTEREDAAGRPERPRREANAAMDTQRRLRGHQFLPPKADLAKIPGALGQAQISEQDLMVHAHYFTASGDWWITELWQEEPEEEGGGGQWLAYGYALLAAYPDGAEWGTISLDELEQLRVNRPRGLPLIVERDMGWEPRPFREVQQELQARYEAREHGPEPTQPEHESRPAPGERLSASSPDGGRPGEKKSLPQERDVQETGRTLQPDPEQTGGRQDADAGTDRAHRESSSPLRAAGAPAAPQHPQHPVPREKTARVLPKHDSSRSRYEQARQEASRRYSKACQAASDAYEAANRDDNARAFSALTEAQIAAERDRARACHAAGIAYQQETGADATGVPACSWAEIEAKAAVARWPQHVAQAAVPASARQQGTRLPDREAGS